MTAIVEGPLGIAYPHNLPELCRTGKIDPSASFLATNGFYMTKVTGAHPLLEWFAVYVFSGTEHVLEVRAVEPATYVDASHELPFDPQKPSTFALSPQVEIQYTLPTKFKPEKIEHFLYTIVVGLLEGKLAPDRDTGTHWHETLDSLCDSLVWA